MLKRIEWAAFGSYSLATGAVAVILIALIFGARIRKRRCNSAAS
jgi:hypothetical protein